MALRILIIDDDDDDLEMFCRVVKQLNPDIECKTATDGEAGLMLLKSDENFRPDYIFLDLNMPGMNGFQVLTEIKKDSTLRHIPVIIYTTSKREEDRTESLRRGAVHFISKPYGRDELYNSILFVLERKWETAIVKSVNNSI